MSADLAAFLLARIAEDEQVARGRRRCDGSAVECEAKRRIVASIQGWRHEVVEDCWYTCPAATEEREGETCCNDNAGDQCNCGRDARAAQILNALALPYSAHPDFDPAWRPRPELEGER